jgi:hypothetical protein
MKTNREKLMKDCYLGQSAAGNNGVEPFNFDAAYEEFSHVYSLALATSILTFTMLSQGSFTSLTVPWKQRFTGVHCFAGELIGASPS